MYTNSTYNANLCAWMILNVFLRTNSLNVTEGVVLLASGDGGKSVVKNIVHGRHTTCAVDLQFVAVTANTKTNLIHQLT